MSYQVGVVGHFRPRVPVGDQTIPRTYEIDAIPTEDDTRPAVFLKFEVIDGVPQCREIRIASTVHGREVRRADLNVAVEDYLHVATVSVGQPIASETQEEGRLVITFDQSNDDAFGKQIDRVRGESRRSGPSDDDLREVAAVYRENSKAPVKAVQQHIGKTLRTATSWVALARKKGFL